MRGGLCGKLHGGRSQLLFTLQQSLIDSQLFAGPTCIRRPRFGGPRRNISMTFGVEKLEWCGYPTVKNF